MKTSLTTLVIDTATSYLYVGLFEDKRAIDEVYQKGHNDHSVTLMDAISQLFEKHSLKAESLNRIVVGIGPGSYTGVRVGVVVAKMLGWSLSIPVYTVSSLAMMASSQVSGKTLAWIDARRGRGFMGVFETVNSMVKRLEDDVYDRVDTIKSRVEYDQAIEEGKPDFLRLDKSDLLEEVKDIHLLAPIYLRETEAEIELQKK